MSISVQTFFNKYCEALMSFSPEQIAAHYNNPVTIYSDNGIQQVDDDLVNLTFWQQGVKPYKEMGITKATFQILSEEQLSQKNYITKVQWINYNASGAEVSKETNVYILTGDKEDIKISGLILLQQ